MSRFLSEMFKVDWTMVKTDILISKDALTTSVHENVNTMDFCSNCGSHLKQTAKGLVCPKCGKLVPSSPFIKEEGIRKRDNDVIYVVEESKDNYVKVSRLCPNCGNGEAFYWSSTAIGEHAGVRQERTIEHFRCVKCMHTWSESS